MSVLVLRAPYVLLVVSLALVLTGCDWDTGGIFDL
jgi:hypothetical protein